VRGETGNKVPTALKLSYLSELTFTVGTIASIAWITRTCVSSILKIMTRSLGMAVVV